MAVLLHSNDDQIVWCRAESAGGTGHHLGDLTLVQYGATYQLYIVMDHIPGNGFSGRVP